MRRKQFCVKILYTLLVTGIQRALVLGCIIKCHLKLFHFLFTRAAPQEGCMQYNNTTGFQTSPFNILCTQQASMMACGSSLQHWHCTSLHKHTVGLLNLSTMSFSAYTNLCLDKSFDSPFGGQETGHRSHDRRQV